MPTSNKVEQRRQSAVMLRSVLLLFLIVLYPLPLVYSQDTGSETEYESSEPLPAMSPFNEIAGTPATTLLPLSFQSSGPQPRVPTQQNLVQFLGSENSADQFSTGLFNGAATYTYSIEVPPGRNNLEPSIVIQYNHHGSQGRPGVVGSGWALSDNLIYRDPQYTLADTSDDIFRISLNGINDKLVPANDGRYHTATESFLWIKKVEDSWRVRAKDGTEYRFGDAQDSKMLSNINSYTTQWHLREVRDTHDNTVLYSYQQNPHGEQGTMYLSRINYNDGASTIDFRYEFGLYPPWEVYQLGQYVKQSGLLTGIDVKHQNSLVRKYQFVYHTLDHPSKIFLKQIYQYGKDGSTPLPPTEFSYIQPGKSWLNASWSLPSGVQFGDKNGEDTGVRLLDVNGDGLTDVVQNQNTDTFRYWQNLRGNWATEKSLPGVPGGIMDSTRQDEGVQFVDMNNDGKLDVLKLRGGKDAIRKYLRNTGNSFVEEAVPVPPEINFIENTVIGKPCEPSACPAGYDDFGGNCTENACTRVCQRISCTNNGRVVHQASADLTWYSMSNSNSRAQSPFIVSNQIKCYGFKFTPSGYSSCYDLETDRNRNGDYHRDCEGVDIDAYGGVGFEALRSPDSWLSTLNLAPGSAYGGSAPNADWKYRYFVRYGAHYYARDGDWNGFEDQLCSRSTSAAEIFCAPSLSGCATWGKERCGWGCFGQSTQPAITMGVFRVNYGDARDAMVNQWACGSIKRNDFMGSSGTYDVMEYDSIIDTMNQTCSEPIEIVKNTGIRIADLNADGYPDFIQATPSQQKVWLRTPGGYTLSPRWQLPFGIVFADGVGNDQGVVFSDINGDGYVDLLKAKDDDRRTWLNNGQTWIPSSRTLPVSVNVGGQEQGVVILDINGDGLSDIVHSDGNSKFKTWINTGASWIEDSSWNVPTYVSLKGLSTRFLDADGQSTVDLAVATANNRVMLNNAAVKSYLLNQIKTPTGGTISIDYTEIASIDNTGGDGINDLGFSGWVVSRIQRDNGMSGGHSVMSQTRYNYSGGAMDYADREFRGFNVVTEKLVDGSQVIHTFYQDDVKRGIEYETKILDSNNKLYYRTFKSIVSRGIENYAIVQVADENSYLYDGKTDAPKINSIRYSYDSYGNINQKEMLGDTIVPTDDYKEVTEYVYNPELWIVSLPKRTYIDSNSVKSRETLFMYDKNNIGEPPQKGDITRMESVHSKGNAVALFEYDQYGNKISTTDTLGHRTQLAYDSTSTFPIKIMNAKNQITTTEYDGSTGNILSQVDANGIKTEYRYDLFGRAVKEILPGDTNSSPAKSTEYNFDGNAPEIVRISSKVSSDERYDSYSVYDGFGQLVQTRDQAVEEQIVRDYFYDGRQRLTEYSNPYRAPTSSSYSSQVSPRATINYDSLSRITSLQTPDGNQSRYSYDHWLTQTFDPNNHETDYLYDAFGRIIEVREHNRGELYTTQYQYLPTGELVRIRDHQGNELVYTFDEQGRLIQTQDPDKGRTTYEYDSVGNRLTYTDAKGITIQYSYDELDRILRKRSPSMTIDYTYDTGMNGTLSRTRILRGNTILERQFGYDNRLRTTSESRFMGGRELKTRYVFDHQNRIIQKVLPDGSIISYSYTPFDLIRRIENVASFEYAPAGMPTRKNYHNNLQSAYTYHPQSNRLAGIQTGALQSLQYSYDAAGNILELNDVKNAKKTAYTYDDLDRLTRTVNPDYNLSYEYDPVGNMRRQISDSSTLNFNYAQRPAHAPIANTKVSSAQDANNVIIEMGQFRASEQNGQEEVFVPDITRALNEELARCSPDSEGNCLLMMNVSTDSVSNLIFSNLRIDLGKQVNRPPLLEPIATRIIKAGQRLSVTVVASDPDADQLLYSMNNSQIHVSDSPSMFIWDTISRDMGSHDIEVKVSDGFSTITDKFKVIIVGESKPPTIDPINSIEVLEGEPVIIIVNAHDPESDTLLYSVNDTRFSVKDNRLRWLTREGDSGVYSFKILVTDGSNTIGRSFSVTVKDHKSCKQPGFWVCESFEDLDGWTSIRGPPWSLSEGFAVSPGPVAYLRYPPFFKEGKYEFDVNPISNFSEVYFNFGYIDDENRILIEFYPMARGPADVLLLKQQGASMELARGGRILKFNKWQHVMVEWSKEMVSIVVDGVNYFNVSNPSPEEGRIALAAYGTVLFDNVKVRPLKSPPIISAIQNRTVTLWENFTLTINASDIDQKPLSYSINDSRVTKRGENNFEISSGTLGIGRHDFIATVSNGMLSSTSAFSVHVKSINRAPFIISSPPLVARQELPYIYQVQAFDADGDLLNYTLEIPTSWLKMDSLKGTLSGTPRDGQAYQWFLQIKVNDGDISAKQQFAIDISDKNANPKLLNGLEKKIQENPMQNISILINTKNKEQIKAKNIGRVFTESTMMIGVELPAHRIWELLAGTEAKFAEENGKMGFG